MVYLIGIFYDDVGDANVGDAANANVGDVDVGDADVGDAADADVGDTRNSSGTNCTHTILAALSHHPGQTEDEQGFCIEKLIPPKPLFPYQSLVYNPTADIGDAEVGDAVDADVGDTTNSSGTT